MARREFPPSVKVARYKHCYGFCEGCGVRLSTGKFQYDHDKEDTFGGEPTFENCRVLCTPCHSAKTAAAAPAVAKSNAVQKAHIGATRQKQPIKSRGFDKKPRPEKLPMPAPRAMFQ